MHPRGHELRDPLLVLLVAKSPEQAHRHRVGVEVAERCSQALLVELLDHAVRPAPLARRDPPLRRDQRRRVRRAEPVQLGTRLAAELLDVGEALGGDEGGAGHLSLEQRVGADGHPVHEPLHLACAGSGAVEHRLHRGEHALGLVGRRCRGLRGDEPLAGQERGVGERPAHVDAE